jgi:hypothetical protein
VRRLPLLVAIATPSAAFGYEDQLAVGLDLGYAQVAAAPGGAGFGGGPQAKLGLDDTWNLYAAGFYAFHPEDSLHVGTLAAGVEYVFDVLQWIPWGGFGIEALGAAEDGSAGLEAGAQAALGVDYLADRAYSFGLTARWHAVLSDLERFPIYFTLALRGSLLWDL